MRSLIKIVVACRARAAYFSVVRDVVGDDPGVMSVQSLPFWELVALRTMSLVSPGASTLRTITFALHATRRCACRQALFTDTHV
jgi:hypothetical protein